MADGARTGMLVAAQNRLRSGLIARLVALIVAMLTAYQRGPRTDQETATLVSRLMGALEQGDRTAARLGTSLVAQTFPEARTSAPTALPSTWTQDEVQRIVQEWLDNPVRDVVEQSVTEHVAQAQKQGVTSTRVPGVTGVTGWRRIIHPELSKSGTTCGLCIAAAAGRKYTTGNLEPIHDGCNCGVLPIIGDNDPGEALNRLDLGDLYDEAGGTTDGWTLKQTRYEMGPDGQLVAVKTREKKGPREPMAKIQKRAKQADRARGPVPSARAQKGIEGRSPEWLRQQISITEGLPESDWRTQQLARLRKALRAAE